MKKVFLILSFLICHFSFSVAQTYTPSEENLKARAEFQDNKFGIFLHWGVYSMLADGEWVQYSKKINADEYAKLPAGFYPSKFDAREWVKAIKASGARYITITSRHHDSFSMFGTKASDYNIVDATPFKRDVLKELSEACRAEGIKLHFYYSHLDWHRKDYPVNDTKDYYSHDHSTDNYDTYYAFMNQQLTELLTNYGPIGAIWFDGVWDHPASSGFDWRLEEQYQMIHKLQPACLIGNNHHDTIVPGEDFQLFEQDLPGENTAGFSNGQKVQNELPLEACMTMNNTWGYSITDKSYKSAEELIRKLVRSAGMNSNLLLNIGPRPDGQLPVEAVNLLKEIGEFMDKYGESIYGTRGGCVPPQKWGVTTQKGNTLYLHLLTPEDGQDSVVLPIEKKKIKAARRFGCTDMLKIQKEDNQTRVLFGEEAKGLDYVVEIELK